MTGTLSPKLRLVRCPKCHRVLPEPTNVPVYKCGGCNTVLKAKICKNGTKDTDVHVPDTNMGKKKELEQDSESNEAQNLSKEDREAQSLSKEERLSSSGELPLDKNNGSDEKENEDSNMNQSGITHHGNEESLPVAEADQDKCSLKQNKGGNPKEYVQGNGKHFGLVNFLDEVDSPTEPNHHKSAESELDKSRNCMEEENGGVNFSDEVASPTEPDHHKSAERLSSAGELPLDINNGSDEMENKDSNMNLSGITRLRNEELLPVAEAVHDKSSSKQNNGGNPKDYVQCNGKHVGEVNFSDEVASPTEPNHHKSAESEVDKTRNGMEEENGGVNFSYEVASPTELNHRKSAERLSSAGALLLDKSNGSEEMENKASNMNQSGITRHGIEESLPVAEDKCSLKQSNGGNPEDYVQHNRKHVGGVNFSDEVASPTEPNHHKSVESEADKNGNCVEEENGGVNISDEVASSTELNHLDSEESSLVAEARSELDEIGCCLEQENGRNQNEYVICDGKQTGGITELNDNVIGESSPVVRASSEANENRTFLEQNNGRNQSEFGDVKRGTLSRNSKSSEVSLSTERVCQEIEESTAVIETNRKLDENSKSPTSLDRTQKRQLTGFECVGSVDTLENIAVANYSSEFSVTHRDAPTFPTSNYGYEGSVSSYDGNDDQVPDPFLHLYERKFKKAKSPKAKAMHKRDEVMNKITSYPDMEHEAWNCSSIPSEKKHYTRKGKWHQDELMEPTRRGPPARSRTKFESGGYQPRVPFYSRVSHVGYDKGGPSNYRREEFQYRSSLHSPNKPEKNPEEEKMELLKRVIELQEQLTRTHISQGVAPKVDMYPRRFHQGTRWPHQNRTSRIPFSAEAKMSRCQVDNSCFHCCPHDRMSSAPLPPHVFCNRSPYTAQRSPRYSNLFSSTPSSPQYRTSSEFSLQSYDANCDDRELKKYYRERNRLKRHVRPVAGGAPFIICYRCSEVLQVPLDFLLAKRRFHKLMCGACSSTLKFSLQDGTCISPYTGDYALDAIAPPPSEVDDYGPSLGKSCSTEVEPFSVELPFQSVKRDSYERKTSFESFSEPTGERKGGPILKVLENKNKNPVETFAAAGPSSSKAGKTSSEIEELRPTSGSPLHTLMGYTSPSQVMDR